MPAKILAIQPNIGNAGDTVELNEGTPAALRDRSGEVKPIPAEPLVLILFGEIGRASCDIEEYCIVPAITPITIPSMWNGNALPFRIVEHIGSILARARLVRSSDQILFIVRDCSVEREGAAFERCFGSILEPCLQIGGLLVEKEFPLMIRAEQLHHTSRGTVRQIGPVVATVFLYRPIGLTEGLIALDQLYIRRRSVWRSWRGGGIRALIGLRIEAP